jgi:hypothetical protein
MADGTKRLQLRAQKNDRNNLSNLREDQELEVGTRSDRVEGAVVTKRGHVAETLGDRLAQ